MMNLIAISGSAAEISALIPSLLPAANHEFVPPPVLAPLHATAAQHEKLDASGMQLPMGATDHVVLIDRKLGLMIDTRDNRKANHRDAPKVAAETDLLGFTDWRLPDDIECFLMFERANHYNPAVDPTLYPNAKSSDFIWTSTVGPEDSDYAFAVYCDSGSASWSYRGYNGVVRAVRSLAPAVPSPGQ